MVRLSICLLISAALSQVSGRQISGHKKLQRTIRTRSTLDEAENIQLVADYFVCVLSNGLTSAAQALGMSSIITVCNKPPSIVAASIPVPCTSSDPEVCHQQELALKGHNDFRALHHAAPLIWNDTLADAALKWVNNCKFHHSGGTLLDEVYGENLYSSTLVTPQTSMTDVLLAYTNEESLYDYNNPVFDLSTGHFTQVVWKDSTQVGCAIINCPVDTLLEYAPISAFSSCVYTSAGNWSGEYEANVLRP